VASFKPGLLGLEPEVKNLNDGTHVRALSPRPGPAGSKTSIISSVQDKKLSNASFSNAGYKKAEQTKLLILRQSSRGAEVQKLQHLLNLRLLPSPNLPVDGVFDAATQQALIKYQQGIAITSDGVAGKDTWYYLLKGDMVKVAQALVPKAQVAVPLHQAISKPVVVSKVWEWSLTDKFTEVLRRTVSKLPSSMRGEFEALLSPGNLAIMAGTLVVWVGSHAFGVGEIADIVLLVGGVFFLGMAVFDVAEELGDFLVLTADADNEKDLDKAASHLARAISIMGVVAFVALLAKVARGRGGAASEASAESVTTAKSPSKLKKGGQVEEPPKKTDTVHEMKIKGLTKQGHGPQRHEGDVTENQLDRRVRLKEDPETGARADKYQKDNNGNPANHKCGDHATKVNSEESYVKAEEHSRNSQAFKDKVSEGQTDIKVETPLEDTYGAGYKKHVSGRSRTTPWPDTTTPSVPTNFENGGVMKAIYKRNAQGGYDLITMYPDPK
jgi:hypothetical protein